MKKSQLCSSAMKKSFVFLLIVVLIIAGASVTALAAPSTQQQPPANRQSQFSGQRAFTWDGPGNYGRGGVITFGTGNRPGGWGNMLFRCGFAFAFLICLVCSVMLAVYVHMDAKRIGLRGLFWWAILVFLTNVFGLLIYLLHKQRKEYPELWRTERQGIPAGQVRVCPNCNLAQSASNAFCHACGTRIAGGAQEESFEKPAQ